MNKEIIRSNVEKAYEDFVRQAFATAVSNAILGEKGSENRFKHAVEVASKVKDDILALYT